MEPAEKKEDPAVKEKKLRELQQNLYDIRQGLVTIQDFYSQFAALSKRRNLDDGTSVALPTVDESGEFESLWHFLSEGGYLGNGTFPDPTDALYASYCGFCRDRGLTPVDRDAFDFVLVMQEKERSTGTGA
ncbi:MAG: hypothetical protein ABFC24_08050 [Methanoregulaceae archaeon]